MRGLVVVLCLAICGCASVELPENPTREQLVSAHLECAAGDKYAGSGLLFLGSAATALGASPAAAAVAGLAWFVSELSVASRLDNAASAMVGRESEPPC